MDMQSALNTLADGGNLSRDAMRGIFLGVMSGDATPAQIGALLMGLRCKGETVEEIAGAVDAMRALSTRVAVDAPYLIDTCGTGGSGQKLFNISTAAALVAAAAGAHVAKHGNRKASSQSGAADLLEAAGASIALTPAQIARCITEVGVGFMFAPAHHSAMRHVAPVRGELKIRTMMNLLGPLTNPAGARRQLMGVFDRAWLRPLTEVLQMLGSEAVLLVNCGGLDEMGLHTPTHCCELRAGTITEYLFDPRSVGIERQATDSLQAASIADSLRLVRSALSGEPGPAHDIVALNAGAAIYVSGVANSMDNGVEMARDAIAAGLAQEKLDELVRITSLMAEEQ
ncbi:MAG: anthranilate phosphoribosyltransferase [Pseudomonadales bacterium]|nr:anthranilate phosphoribosyltransferase [Pseudomonadales bacterium]MCP5184374.1 anthranilate phosphoribosyltransferase [Pseudomonadales bacterium]